MKPDPISQPRRLSSISTILFLAAAAAAAILGGWLISYDMRYGPWAGSDSVGYIVYAESLVEGRGLTMRMPAGNDSPLTLHPPLYSIVIAPFILLGADPILAAQIINVICFVATLILLVVGPYWVNGSFEWGWLVAIIILVSPSMLEIFTGAMSEPLFILLTYLNIFLAARYWTHPSKKYWILSAVFAGLAGVTRYIGVASLILACLPLFTQKERPIRARILDSLLYAAIASLPLAVWLVSGLVRYGTFGARQIQTSLQFFESINRFRRGIVEAWVTWIPNQISIPTWSIKSGILHGLILIVLVLFVLFLIKLRRERSKESGARLPRTFVLYRVFILYLAGFLGFLYLSYTYSSIQPDLSPRMFTPIQPILFYLITGVLLLWIETLSLRWIYRLVPVALCLFIAVAYLPATRHQVTERHASGSGYTSREWRGSTLIQEVKRLPAEIPQISNQAAAILLYTGRFPYEINEYRSKQPLEEFTRFGEGNLKEEIVFREQCAALILFDGELRNQFVHLYGDQTGERLLALTDGLQVYSEAPDGKIYFPPGCPMPSG